VLPSADVPGAESDFLLLRACQVEASMNQVAQNQMRLYDLPSKLLCRVLNVELKVSSSPSPLRFSAISAAQLRSLRPPSPDFSLM
jgi:hypothetical protein